MTENYILENDKKIYPVYNESNFLITKDEIEKILKENGINKSIFNLDIWQKAFIHKSMSSSSEMNVIHENNCQYTSVQLAQMKSGI